MKYLLLLSLFLFGCAEKRNAFEYPTEQKYENISSKRGFDVPMEYR